MAGEEGQFVELLDSIAPDHGTCIKFNKREKSVQVSFRVFILRDGGMDDR